MIDVASSSTESESENWASGASADGVPDSLMVEPELRVIEEKALNAWPGLQQVVCDGWMLRFAGGYTRRANAVIPLYEGQISAERKVGMCEERYAMRGLPTVFKMLPFARPAGLDRILHTRGYRKEAETSVQVCHIRLLDLPVEEEVKCWSAPEVEWLEAQASCCGGGVDEQPQLRAILGNIVPEHCFAALLRDGQPVSCGIGVVEDGFLGIFSVATQARQRHRGFGRQLIGALARWGRLAGAAQAYLQVVDGNEPARRLYAGLGFREMYRYWYRINGHSHG